MAPAGGGNIKVVVRVRPFNGRGMANAPSLVMSVLVRQTRLETTRADALQKSIAGQDASSA